MKSTEWLNRYLAPICTICGQETNNKSRICTICRQTCPLCGLAKSYHAKICLACKRGKKKRKKGKRREKSNRRSIPTLVTLEDGTVIQTRSKLEASWIIELQHCSLVCYECQSVPCMQNGKYGLFLGSYLPDLLLQDQKGNEYHCELKPTAAIAEKDSRPQRALAYNKDLKFIIIGGEPYEPGGFYVKLLSSEGIKIYEAVELDQLMQLFGC